MSLKFSASGLNLSLMTSALEAATRGAMLVRAPHLGTIAVLGPDRQSWLNGLVTSDLTKLGPGSASYGLVLVKIGRILADVWVLSADDRLLVGAPRDRIPTLREHFEKYLIMEDATHVDASHEFSWAFAHGPRAGALLGELPQRHGAYGGTFDVTGLGGGALVAPQHKLEALLAEMARESDVVIASEEDWETLRVRRFLPRFSVDFGDKNYPQEAALEKIAVSFNKGCYLGQEVVCRLEMRGHVVKKIVPLRLTAGDPPAAGVEVRSKEGKVLGSISSAASDDGAPVALAMVRVDFTQPGTKLDVAGREATVIGQPQESC